MAASRERLPPNTRVGSYRIVQAIDRGGFSLIYLASELSSGAEVVIKEYMPKVIARRDPRLRVVPDTPDQTFALLQGRTLFFREIQALSLLRHPNIVRVLGFFLANGTGYLVMPHEPGRNLAAYLEERRGALSTAFVLEVFRPILDALALLHQRSMLHLDVKPANIHLRQGNRPLLLDLGATRGPQSVQPGGGLVITAGYSPLEQYSRAGKVGPWTDVYAVGASILNCMAGSPPAPAPERRDGDEPLDAILAGLRDRYPAFLIEAVKWSLTMDPARRPQDAATLLAALVPPTSYSSRERSHETL